MNTPRGLTHREKVGNTAPMTPQGTKENIHIRHIYKNFTNLFDLTEYSTHGLVSSLAQWPNYTPREYNGMKN